MSTRAHIRITDGDRAILLYRHCDGYPNGCGVDLQRVVEKQGFGDAEYLAGCIVRVDPMASCPTFTPAISLHGDESYIWTVDCDGKEIRYSDGGDEVVYYKEAK